MMNNNISTEEYEKQISALKLEVELLKKKLTADIKRKPYGLNWIDVPEGFEQETENSIPILEEVKDKAIKNNDGKPTHILIEGDNYHALSCLNYTHKGKIDVIYIDPPYNTGSDGFTYKDKRFLTEYPDGTTVPKDHPLRHSYWLSFMSKRLKLARNLLSDKGVIFISIDDNEQANLKLLCDEIFGAENFIAELPTIMNLKGNQDEFGFAGTHEYTIVYSKNISKIKLNNFNIEESGITDWLEDEIGYYKKGATLKRTGQDAPRASRPYGFYPILVNNKTKKVSTISICEFEKIYNPKTTVFDDKYIKYLQEEYINKGYSFLLPITDDKETSWRWSRNKVEKENYEIIVIGEEGCFSLYKKQRPEIGDLPTKKPKSIFYKPEYSSGNGTSQIKSIFSDKVFNNPKPLELIKDFLQISVHHSSTILDFFAGSGTTMHATMKLNEKDGGKRQCILVQQNEGENRICENVTYERNRRVIQGYKTAKGEKVEGLGNSLKYYKTSFIGKNPPNSATDNDKISLAQKAGCLISLSENTLEEIESNNFFQIFTDGKRYTGIYFSGDAEKLPEFVQSIQNKKSECVAYIFSWGNPEIFENEFDDMTNITLKSIPEPILEIYKSLNGENK